MIDEWGEAKVAARSAHVSRFGKHLVKERGLDIALGRLFAQTEDARLAADYDGESFGESEARMILDGRNRFLAAVEAILRQANS